jgi:predicted transcriptional regulator
MYNRVTDVMSRDAVSVSPEASLREVAQVLSSNHIGGAPVVVDCDRVIGVIFGLRPDRLRSGVTRSPC